MKEKILTGKQIKTRLKRTKIHSYLLIAGVSLQLASAALRRTPRRASAPLMT